MTHRLSRGELYDLVWSQPIQRLAKQFGISDVALAKTCRRAEIPVPKRGYWAKSQAGKKVTRIALPPRGPGVSDDVFVGGRRYHWYEIPDEELLEPIPLPADFPDDIEETRKLASKKIEKIKVQSTLIHAHPLIARLLEEDNDRREKQLASPYPFSWDKPLFETQSEQRRLRILNALFCALESAGFAPWLRGKDGRDLGIRVGGQSVTLKLERAETSRTGKKSERATNAHPLCLEILMSSGSEGTLRSWSDVQDERIERMLHDIAIEIIVARRTAGAAGFYLQPMVEMPGPIGQAKALRHNALATEAHRRAGRMHRRGQASDRRQPRSQVSQHVICRTVEFERADAHSPVYSAQQCLFKEGREPRAFRGAVRDVL